MLSQMIRGAWLAYVRKLNGAVLGTAADLEEFLFGSDRTDLSGIRPTPLEIQCGACFYCEGSLARTSQFSSISVSEGRAVMRQRVHVVLTRDSLNLIFKRA
jgi:hypothetical protein